MELPDDKSPAEELARLDVEVRLQVDAAEARQEARRLASIHGFTPPKVSQIATAVSELANNLVFHGGGGTMKLRAWRETDRLVFEVVAVDDGPGIADVDLALTDGYSTAGTLGGGLPGVRRLMEDFAIDSKPGRGTRVTARKYQRCK